MSVLLQVQTPYNNIRVVEEYPIRKLVFGTGISQDQSAINLEKPHIHIFDYSIMAMHSVLFVAEPKNIMVIGLGGGVIPKQMAHYFPSANIDVVEIDPKILDIAKEYFYFEEKGNIKVHIGDAFKVIDNLNRKYDVVILDAFNTNYIPFHLMSIEFLRKVYNSMDDKGVVSINVCNIHPSFSSHLKTVKTAFGSNLYYMDGFENIYAGMIFATKTKINPMDVEHISCHFLAVVPTKMTITKEIEKSKIFSIDNP